MQRRIAVRITDSMYLRITLLFIAQQTSNVERMEQMKARLRDAIWNASTDIESVCFLRFFFVK